MPGLELREKLLFEKVLHTAKVLYCKNKLLCGGTLTFRSFIFNLMILILYPLLEFINQPLKVDSSPVFSTYGFESWVCDQLCSLNQFSARFFYLRVASTVHVPGSINLCKLIFEFQILPHIWPFKQKSHDVYWKMFFSSGLVVCVSHYTHGYLRFRIYMYTKKPGHSPFKKLCNVIRYEIFIFIIFFSLAALQTYFQEFSWRD